MNIAIWLEGSGSRAEILQSLTELQNALARTIEPKWTYEDATLYAETGQGSSLDLHLGRRLKLIEDIKTKGEKWDQLAISDAIESAQDFRMTKSYENERYPALLDLIAPTGWLKRLLI